jgi:hypothetical protein
MAIGCQENKKGVPKGWCWKIKKNRKGLQLVTSLIGPRTVFDIALQAKRLSISILAANRSLYTERPRYGEFLFEWCIGFESPRRIIN